FSSRRRHTRFSRDWSSDVCSSDLGYHAYYYRGLRHILKALKGQKLQRAFFVSSSSVYHQMDGEWVDETSETRPSSFAGKEMLAAEEALLKADVPGTVVRFTGIYGPGRTRMI